MGCCYSTPDTIQYQDINAAYLPPPPGYVPPAPYQPYSYPGPSAPMNPAYMQPQPPMMGQIPMNPMGTGPQAPMPQPDGLPAVPPGARSSYTDFLSKYEISQVYAQRLTKLFQTHLVLIADDSGSMKRTISDPRQPGLTRWMELQRLASVVAEFGTIIDPQNGVDIYFLNRPPLRNVQTIDHLQETFNRQPGGFTPLARVLQQVIREKYSASEDRDLLIVIITDGEPTDDRGNEDLTGFTRTLYAKPKRVHVSVAACTDVAEDMEYLDALDGKIPNYDATDDYREERDKVIRIQGYGTRFSYADYVVKILMATYDRWFFNLDQVRQGRLRF